MKRVISAVLVSILLLIMSACGTNDFDKKIDATASGKALTEAVDTSIVNFTHTVIAENSTVLQEESSTVKRLDVPATICQESQTRESRTSAFQLYQQYYYDNFGNNCGVYLADITHNGQDDMLVLIDLQNSFPRYQLQVFTIKDGRVVMIYETRYRAYRSQLFLTASSGECNLVEALCGVWQGLGAQTCKEYYLTNGGEEVLVNEFNQEFGGDEVVRESFGDSDERDAYIEEQDELATSKYIEMIKQNYGEAYCKLFLLLDSYDEIVPQCPQLNLNSDAVFGD